MKKLEVHAGEKYGMLTVVKFHHSKTLYYSRKDASYRKKRLGKRTYNYYECICDCGNTCVVEISHLRSGHTVSCGCYRKWKNLQSCSKKVKHGLSGHALYGTWCKIHQRCYSPKNLNYPNYGGRGIKMSDSWESSPAPFIAWAESNGWYPGCGLTVDRIDVNGDYSEENCRLATIEVQNKNKRNNRYITFEGETLTITDWAKKLGITSTTLRKRLNHPNWSFKDAMTKTGDETGWGKKAEDYDLTAIRAEEQEQYFNKLKTLREDKETVIPRVDLTMDSIFRYNNVEHTIGEWAEFIGIKPHILLRRLKLGWLIEDALFLSPRRRDEGTN